jgi:ABC-type hemin transport system substrate-binding protein
LIAEEVAKVDPGLVIRDDEGRPYSVRYEAINAMLLNEFLKEHKKVQQLETTVAQLKSTVAKQEKDFAAQLKALDTKIQTVNDKVELKKSSPRTVENH